MVSVCAPSCGWTPVSLMSFSSRRWTSNAPVIALQPSCGRELCDGAPRTVMNTSMRPRLPRLMRLPLPPRMHMSARTPSVSTTLRMASWRPVSPETQHRNTRRPSTATPLRMTASMACSIAAMVAFCSLSPFPITASPGRPCGRPSMTSPE